MVSPFHEHFSWLIWSLVPMSGFICIKQFYDGIELTRIPMILSGFSVVLNLILNFILIYGWSSIPAFGLEGSGIASFISRTLMFFILTLQMSFNKKLKPFGLWQFTIKLASVRKFLRLALPSSRQHTSEVAAFSALAIIAVWFGPKQQAAHQIAITIAAFSYVIYVGLGTAASIRIGESFGRRDHQLILRNGKDSIALAISLAFFLFIILLFFRHTLVMGFNHDEEVLRIASHLLIYGAAFQFSDALQALGIGILRGLQDVRIPTVITTFSYWMIGIPAGYFFSTTLGMKTDGIWLGFVLCLTISAALLIRRFFRLG
ncbi:MAG: MATE family efflux transporter [Saprospiraceae bacterium]